MIRLSCVLSAALPLGIFYGCAFVQNLQPGLVLTDAEMVGVLESFSDDEAQAAELARQASTSPEVQAFAGRVLNEHRQLADQNRRLGRHLDLPSREPALAAKLKADHEAAMHALQMKSGADFDRAYVQYEIDRHVQAFGLIESAAESETTLPLREELVRTGPDLLSHLSAARALERRLVAQEGQAPGPE